MRSVITNDPYWPNLPPQDEIRHAPRLYPIEVPQKIWNDALHAAAEYLRGQSDVCNCYDVFATACEIEKLEMPK